MTPRRGRRVALWACLGGALVLGGACYAIRNGIQEEYWLWKLRHGDEAERIVAVDMLGEMRSQRAIGGITLIRDKYDTRLHPPQISPMGDHEVLAEALFIEYRWREAASRSAAQALMRIQGEQP